jgi:hypothetical protein
MASVSTVSQQQKLEVSAQQFYNELAKKHPTLATQHTIDVIIQELQLMGLYQEFVSVASLWGAFYAAVSKNLLTIPPAPIVLTPETVERLRAQFPPHRKNSRAAGFTTR